MHHILLSLLSIPPIAEQNTPDAHPSEMKAAGPRKYESTGVHSTGQEKSRAFRRHVKWNLQTVPVDSIIASGIIHGSVTYCMPCTRYIVLVCARGTGAKGTESEAREKRTETAEVGVGRCKNRGVPQRNI